VWPTRIREVTCGVDMAAMIGVVAGSVGNRSVENRAVADFLIAAGVQPSVLVIEGEAGIGKTTLWLAAIEQARERGFRVLSARAGQAESILAYAAVADLLGDVESAVLTALPDVQRVALERVLLRANGSGPATDQRVVAAAFLSVVEGLAVDTPVLVAIDDVQWLDSSSKNVVASPHGGYEDGWGCCLPSGLIPTSTTRSGCSSAGPTASCGFVCVR
jgi:predicted ATPase